MIRKTEASKNSAAAESRSWRQSDALLSSKEAAGKIVATLLPLFWVFCKFSERSACYIPKVQ